MTIETQIIQFPGGKRRFDLERDTSGVAFLHSFFEFNQEVTFEAARGALQIAQLQGNFPADPRVRTDNVFDKNPALVKPLGKIEYFARLSPVEAIVGIYDIILERSPVRTGSYRDANWVFVNGRRIATNPFELKAYLNTNRGGLKPGDTIRFVNVAPYARKLELSGVRRGTRGKTAGLNVRLGRKRVKSKKQKRSILIAKPNGAYALAQRLARSKFKSAATRIKFQFVASGSGGISIPSYKGGRTTFKNKGNGKGSAGRPYVYPSIVLEFSGKGITNE